LQEMKHYRAGVVEAHGGAPLLGMAVG
jgi:hypothetical protein